MAGNTPETISFHDGRETKEAGLPELCQAIGMLRAPLALEGRRRKGVAIFFDKLKKQTSLTAADIIVLTSDNYVSANSAIEKCPYVGWIEKHTFPSALVSEESFNYKRIEILEKLFRGSFYSPSKVIQELNSQASVLYEYSATSLRDLGEGEKKQIAVAEELLRKLHRKAGHGISRRRFLIDLSAALVGAGLAVAGYSLGQRGKGESISPPATPTSRPSVTPTSTSVAEATAVPTTTPTEISKETLLEQAVAEIEATSEQERVRLTKAEFTNGIGQLSEYYLDFMGSEIYQANDKILPLINYLNFKAELGLVKGKYKTPSEAGGAVKEEWKSLKDKLALELIKKFTIVALSQKASYDGNLASFDKNSPHVRKTVSAAIDLYRRLNPQDLFDFNPKGWKPYKYTAEVPHPKTYYLYQLVRKAEGLVTVRPESFSDNDIPDDPLLSNIDKGEVALPERGDYKLLEAGGGESPIVFPNFFAYNTEVRQGTPPDEILDTWQTKNNFADGSSITPTPLRWSDHDPKKPKNVKFSDGIEWGVWENDNIPEAQTVNVSRDAIFNLSRTQPAALLYTPDNSQIDAAVFFSLVKIQDTSKSFWSIQQRSIDPQTGKATVSIYDGVDLFVSAQIADTKSPYNGRHVIGLYEAELIKELDQLPSNNWQGLQLKFQPKILYLLPQKPNWLVDY